MRKMIASIIHFSPSLMFVASAVCFFTRGSADAGYLVLAGILAHLILQEDKG